MNRTPLEAARALHAALEAGVHGDALRAYFTEDASVVEHPNLLKPRGGNANLERALAASTQGAGLLSKQTYVVRDAVEHRDLAILRVTWTGILARDLGPCRAGQGLTAHIAQFIRVRDGRVASIETFDCYEPLSA